MSFLKSAFSAALLILALCPLLIGWACETSGQPVIEVFAANFDLICASDKQQVTWATAHASSVSLSIRNKSGATVVSQSVPLSSNGWQDVPQSSSLPPGDYEIVIEAKNSKGAVDKKAPFTMVSSNGTWHTFTKFVQRLPNSPWYGFSNEPIPISGGQSQTTAPNEIAVSPGVFFRKIKWTPEPFDWPTATESPNDCDDTAAMKLALRTMSVAMGTTSLVMEADREYQFLQGWTIPGTLLCTVNWSPCNWGVQGDDITDQEVRFYLYLEAYCK